MQSWLSSMYITRGVPQFLMFEAHWTAWALALAFAKAGSKSAARIAIMAMTTRSSIKVKPERERAGFRARLLLEAPEAEEQVMACIGDYRTVKMKSLRNKADVAQGR